MSRSAIIPGSITRDEFLAAIEPLLDLCGVTANEVGTDIHIVGVHEGLEIRFDIVPAALSADPVEYPEGEVVSRSATRLAPEHEWSEYRVPLSIKVAI